MLSFYPQASFYQPSPRERYLHAIAEERAARQRYLEDLSEQYAKPYAHPYADPYGYEEVSTAQARDYLRRRQLAIQEERQRQQEQQAMELERRRQRAELERQKQMAELRRRWGMGHTHLDPHMNPWVRMFNADHESEEPPRSRRAPATYEERDAAAKIIQSAFRAYSFRRKALSSISTIRDSLQSLSSAFTFPPNPIFTNTDSPKLAFNATNAPIHAFEDALVNLLSKLDSVESNGDTVIRKARKALAREIEGVLEGVDAKKQEEWEACRVNQIPASSPTTKTEVIAPESELTTMDFTSTPLPPSPLQPAISTNDSDVTELSPSEECNLPQPTMPIEDDVCQVDAHLHSHCQESTAESEDAEMGEVEDIVVVDPVAEDETSSRSEETDSVLL